MIKPLTILLILIVIAAFGPLLLNRPPLFQPPGLWPRLAMYFGRNEAAITVDAARTNLRSPIYPGDLTIVRQRVLAELDGLCWRLVDASADRFHVVVETPLLHFQDDLVIHLLPVAKGVRLDAVSRSRLGKADFGANERHLIDLLQALARDK